jgi:hypothetical protein
MKYRKEMLLIYTLLQLFKKLLHDKVKLSKKINFARLEEIAAVCMVFLLVIGKIHKRLS